MRKLKIEVEIEDGKDLRVGDTLRILSLDNKRSVCQHLRKFETRTTRSHGPCWKEKKPKKVKGINDGGNLHSHS